ncbi:actin-binding ADF family protein [Streptomyces lavendulocolor]|uniref:actin-binding ADF family protein n=1 Tax=Streptomyces lavendulocolor TaxID=67316 RepID=UPI003C2B1185
MPYVMTGRGGRVSREERAAAGGNPLAPRMKEQQEMSSHEIPVTEECVKVFEDLKFKRLTYVIYKINDSCTHIVVDQSGESADYDEFLKILPERDCRWAAFDFEYQDNTGATHNKIVFISWSPAGSPTKSKMLYSTSRRNLRVTLSGVGVDVEGSDFDDVSRESVREKILEGR